MSKKNFIMEPKSKRACAVCGAAATQLCSGCRSLHYCSKAHQLIHWKDHKTNCKLYRIDWDASVGHHLVASRDIPAGTIILQEFPLMIFPFREDGKEFCLGCSVKLYAGEGRPCPRCKWPMCGRDECWQEGSHHALGECSAIKAAHGRPWHVCEKGSCAGYQTSIMVLRCLSLKERDSNSWDKLTNLKHCCPSEQMTYVQNLQHSADVVKFINQQWLPNSKVSEALINKLCVAFFANDWKFPTRDSHNNYQGFHAVYSVASLMDHNCLPNAEHTFSSKKGKILVRAVLPISKGSRITLSQSTDPLHGTSIRRANLLNCTKFRNDCPCRCQRCCDPSELGSYASGMICCPTCPNKDGIMLPDNPLTDDSSPWSCIKCSDKTPAFMINAVMKMLTFSFGQAYGEEISSIAKLESFIRQHAPGLHPHHFLLSMSKLKLCDLYTENLMTSDEDLLKKEILTRELLGLADFISPGASLLRGRLLYHLFTVQDAKYKKLCRGTDMDPEVALPLVLENQKTLREAYSILSWGEETIDEFGLIEKAGSALKELESIHRLILNPL